LTALDAILPSSGNPPFRVCADPRRPYPSRCSTLTALVRWIHQPTDSGRLFGPGGSCAYQKPPPLQV